VTEGLQYLKIGEAAKLIGCSCQTLRRLHKRGILIPELIFDTGHRKYSLNQIEDFIVKNASN